MNAFNHVNLAAACILTSTDKALELGIPKEKWIYVLGGAGTSENEKCTHEKEVLVFLLIVSFPFFFLHSFLPSPN